MTAVGHDDAILGLFMAKLATLTIGSPALPVAWPETPFTPPANGKYLSVSWIPNKPGQHPISSGSVEVMGILQITVVWPKGQGIVAPMKIAAEIANKLPRETVLTGDGVKAKIIRAPYPSGPFSDETKVSIPVTISWQAFVAA